MKLNLTAMMYHYVRDAGDAAEAGSGIPGLAKGNFCAQVDELARTNNMVGWNDIRAAVLGEKGLPQRACVLTFDDGVCDHYWNVFPELKRRNISGLFFVIARENENVVPLPHKLHYLIAKLGIEKMRDEIYVRLNESQREIYKTAEARYRLRWSVETNVVKAILQRELEGSIDGLLTGLLEKYVGTEQELARLFLTQAQIQEMHAGGMNFGGHSRTHPWFDFIDAARRETEIQASENWLATVEQAPFSFAYPYGGLAKDAPHFLGQNNFRAAFSTHEQVAQTDPYYIGRYNGEDWAG